MASSIKIDIELATQAFEASARKAGDKAQEFAKVTSQSTKKIQSGMEDVAKATARVSVEMEKGLTASSAAFASFVGNLGAGAALSAFAALKNAAVSLFDTFVVDGVKAASESEAGLNRLGQAMKSTGDFSEESLTAFQEWATVIQKTTEYEDDAVLAQVALAKSFGLTNTQAKAAVSAALDLSKATGQDLQTAVVALSASYNGQAGKLGKLNAGVKELTEEQLKNGGAVKLLAAQYAGAAAAGVNTFSGALNVSKIAFGDVKEEIGNLIIQNPLLLKALHGATDLFRQGAAAIAAHGDEIKAIISQGFSKLVSIVETTVNALIGMYKWVSDNADALKTAAAAMAIATAGVAAYLVAVNASAIALRAVAIAQAAWAAIMSASPIGLVIAGVAALGAAVFLVTKHWDSIKAAMSRFAGEILSRTAPALNFIIDTFFDIKRGVDILATALALGATMFQELGVTVLTSVVPPMLAVLDATAAVAGIFNADFAKAISASRDRLAAMTADLKATAAAQTAAGKETLASAVAEDTTNVARATAKKRLADLTIALSTATKATTEVKTETIAAGDAAPKAAAKLTDAYRKVGESATQAAARQLAARTGYEAASAAEVLSIQRASAANIKRLQDLALSNSTANKAKELSLELAHNARIYRDFERTLADKGALDKKATSDLVVSQTREVDSVKAAQEARLAVVKASNDVELKAFLELQAKKAKEEQLSGDGLKSVLDARVAAQQAADKQVLDNLASANKDELESFSAQQKRKTEVAQTEDKERGKMVSGALDAANAFITGGLQKGVSSVVGAIGNAYLPGLGTLLSSVFDMLSKAPEEFMKMITSMFNVDFIDNIAKNFVAFFEHLPDLLPGLIEGLIVGILSNLPMIVSALARMLLDPQLFIGIVKAVIGGLIKGIPAFFKSFGAAIAAPFKKFGTFFSDIGKSAKFDGVGKKLSSAFDGAGKQFKQSMSFIGGLGKGFLTSFLKPLEKLGNKIGSIFGFPDLGTKLTSAFTGVVDKISGIINGVFSGVKSAFSKLFNGVAEGVSSAWKSISGFFGGIFDSIGSAMSNAFAAIKNAVGSVFNSITEKIGGIISSVSGAFSKLFNGVAEGVSSAWKSVSGFVGGLIDSVGSSISNTFAAIKNAVGSVFSGIGDAFKSAWSKVKDFMDFGDIGGKLLSALTGAFAGIKNFFKDLFKFDGGGRGGVEKFLGFDFPFIAFAEGGRVPGKANAPGNSYKNDTVPALLSPGEFVLPRSVTADKEFMGVIEARMAGRTIQRHSLGGAIVSGIKSVGGALKSGGQAVGGAVENAWSKVGSLSADIQAAVKSLQKFGANIDPVKLLTNPTGIISDVLKSMIDKFAGNFRQMMGFNAGGLVPGQGFADTVPSMLTPGEFVIRKSVASQNMPTLRALNAGASLGSAQGGTNSLESKLDALISILSADRNMSVQIDGLEIAKAVRRQSQKGFKS